MAIEILDTGLIYANPKPHLRSRQAVFPVVVQMGDGELVASITVGQAFESADMHTEVTRSADGGRTWDPPTPIPLAASPFPTSESGRLTRVRDDLLLCYTPRFDRSDPEHSIGNAETNGLLECDVVLTRSTDRGRTWGPAEVLPLPLPGPFEVATPVLVRPDGRWMALFSTWRAWDGTQRTPEQTCALVSHDEGTSWPDLVTVFADPAGAISYWEARILAAPHRPLLAIAWAHDHSAGRDLPNQFSLSEDGARFGPVRSTGLPGQTCAVEWLPDGRLLCVYNHRHGEPGVRAAVSEFRADSEWPVQEQKVLWGQAAGTAGRSATIVGSMNLFRFGYPRILPLAEGDFLVSFWCLEEAQLVCRWVRLGVS